MSASEKLKAIDPDPWLYDDGTVNYNEGGMKDFRLVLPQIVAVVEAAEQFVDGWEPEHYPQLRRPLAALDEALS